MMKIFILFGLFGALAAQQADLLVDLDEKSYLDKPNTDEEYFIKYCGRDKMEQALINNRCDDPDDWTDDADNDPLSAHVFNQCDYFILPHRRAKSSCVNDIDNCTHGISIVATIKPRRPTKDEGTFSWLLGLGSGKDGHYGVYVGFQNAQVVVRFISSEWDRRIECQLPDRVLNGRECVWYTLAIVRGPREMGPIKIFVDGELLTDCPTEIKRPNPKPPTRKSYSITVGAAISKKQLLDVGYCGLTDQICVFSWPINHQEQRVAREGQGCFDIGLP